MKVTYLDDDKILKYQLRIWLIEQIMFNKIYIYAWIQIDASCPYIEYISWCKKLEHMHEWWTRFKGEYVIIM